MMKLTPEEIENFRSQLADYPDAPLRDKALEELEVVKKCQGDLEIATRVIAKRAGEASLRADSAFDSLLEKSREIICKPEIMEKLAKANNPLIVLELVAGLLPPPFPAVSVTLILLKMGVEYICKLDNSDN
ncbi:MAG: hypothetical protein F6K40_35290 [Okeania sp. SIO3I5]|uniref:hypothetical protein n=1 Tax=Okeania sp. SIO3I5 TaxID=2607805 RepID=UPI0013BCE295|nr:hypothetical protein [Okeania sp. SIO3I5]NEQ41182.1 hypothetical protein [Okeania sp. SIO3I5]